MIFLELVYIIFIFLDIFFEFVKITPPPPDVIILFPLKLITPISPNVPKCLFL